MPHPTRVREPGKPGRPVVYHEFLEVVRKRLRRHRNIKKPLLRRWNRLVGFEQEVLFLVMAGYPVNSIRRLFLDELPNLFTSLSHEGAAYSMAKVVQKAKLGNIYLDDSLQEVLSFYKAGPWNPSGESWMKSQYLDPVYDSPDSGTEDVPSNNTAVEVVSPAVGNRDISPNQAPSGSFEEEVVAMKRLIPAFELTPEEAFMGLTGGGMKSVLAYRSLHKSSPSGLPDAVSFNGIAPVNESACSVEFRSHYALMQEYLPDFSLSPEEIRIGLKDGFEAAMDLWEARKPGKAVVSEEFVPEQNQISAVSPTEVFRNDYRSMQELMPELVLSPDELFVGVTDGFQAAFALWKARQSAGVIPSPAEVPVSIKEPVLKLVPEELPVEEVSPVGIPEEIVPEVAPVAVEEMVSEKVIPEEIPVEVVPDVPVRIIRDGVPKMVGDTKMGLGYFMDVSKWKDRFKLSYTRGFEFIPLYDSELERQLTAHFMNDGVFPKAETLEELAIEFPNGVVPNPGGIISVPEAEVSFKNSAALTVNFYIQQGVVPNFGHKHARPEFLMTRKKDDTFNEWFGATPHIKDISGIFKNEPEYFSMDGLGTCVPVGEVGPGVGRFLLPEDSRYPAFPTYSVMSMVRQNAPKQNFGLVPRNNEDLGNFDKDHDTLVSAWTAFSCRIGDMEFQGRPAVASQLVLERMVEAYYGLDTRIGWNGMLYYGDQLTPPIQPLRIETRRPPAWAIPEGWVWVAFCGLYPKDWIDMDNMTRANSGSFRHALAKLLHYNNVYGSSSRTLPAFLLGWDRSDNEYSRLFASGEVSELWTLSKAEAIFKAFESEVNLNRYSDDYQNYKYSNWKTVPVDEVVRLGGDLKYKFQTGIRPKEGFLSDIKTSFDFKSLGITGPLMDNLYPFDSRELGKFPSR